MEHIPTRYLLDTNAFYALSHPVMQSLCDRGIALYGSPYSCWELLCHLDESNNFERQRAILLKFQYLNILDDPRAEIESLLLSSHPNRFRDDERIQACLAALQASTSIDQFHSSYIHDSQRNLYQVRDVCDRARQELEERELSYVSFASKLVHHLATRSDLADTQDHPDFIYSLVRGEYNKLSEANPSACLSENEIIRCFYAYYGFIFYRCLYFIFAGGTPAKNDYEDASICMHLRIDSEFNPVTDDPGLQDALRQLIATARDCDHINFRMNFEVYDTSHLKRLAQAA